MINSSQNSSVNNQSLASFSDGSSSNRFDLEEATQNLFFQLFIGLFEENHHQIDLESGKIFVT